MAQLKNTTPQHEAGLWIDYKEKVNQSRVFYDSDSILLYNRSRTIEGIALNLNPGENEDCTMRILAVTYRARSTIST